MILEAQILHLNNVYSIPLAWASGQRLKSVTEKILCDKNESFKETKNLIFSWQNLWK